jgi:hypothetical protein
MAHPSSRRVARKIGQAGRSVSHETTNRWRRQGWRPLDGEPRHPLEIARDNLDDAVPVLTGDPMTTSTHFVQGSIMQEKLVGSVNQSERVHVGQAPSLTQRLSPDFNRVTI